jgi:SAM-dependent methyltransferase
VNGRIENAAAAPLRTFAQETAWIEDVVLERTAAHGPLEILEAGCGVKWALRLGDASYRLTGVDLDMTALELRQREVADLDAAVRADLTQAPFAAACFDVVYSAFVLEHVTGVARMLENIDRVTRPGGLVVLRVPDRDSVFGQVARLTPHRTHIWFYRWIRRNPLAGTPGRHPFPTVYEKAMRRSEIRRFFVERGYDLVGERRCRPFSEQEGTFWNAVRLALRLVGSVLPRVSGEHTNVTLIVAKE